MRLARAARSTATQRPSLVVVALGERRIAVPAAWIVEVAPIAAYTPLPSEDRTNLGVVLHRDTLIPLVDLASRLGAGSTGPVALPTLGLFVKTARGKVAFPIDRVLGLQGSPDGKLEDGITPLDPDALGGRHGQDTPH